MRFYNSNHKFHCGVDLHAKSMYLCILNPAGEIELHRNLATNPEEFIRAIDEEKLQGKSLKHDVPPPRESDLLHAATTGGVQPELPLRALALMGESGEPTV